MLVAFGSPVDLNLISIGVVIWTVAISVAFGFYIPVLRARRPASGPPGLRSAAIREDLPAPQDELDRAAPPVAEAGPSAPAAVAPSVPPMARPSRPAEQTGLSRTFNVLIVDDNAVNRQVFELILDSIGLAHVSVENGAEAVEAVAARAFDAVLMDIQMPVMDGFEATRRIRAMETERGEPAAPIIIVSANCLEEHVTLGRAAGADAHLAKPVSAMALIGALETCAFSGRLAA
jgi:CheY-like chemotaxis protein